MNSGGRSKRKLGEKRGNALKDGGYTRRKNFVLREKEQRRNSRTTRVGREEQKRKMEEEEKEGRGDFLHPPTRARPRKREEEGKMPDDGILSRLNFRVTEFTFVTRERENKEEGEEGRGEELKACARQKSIA